MAAAGSREESRTTLEAFDRAFSREVHNLARWPNLTWQQLHNRLQWEGGSLAPILDAERTDRNSSGRPPWIRSRARFRESSVLVETLVGHEGTVRTCAIAADGSFIVSGGEDRTLRIWNPAAGEELRRLEHPSGVGGCAISPDGTFVLSWDFDGSLRRWDVASGAQRTVSSTMSGNVRVGDCALSPEGSFAVSAHLDGTLTVWEIETWTEALKFTGHEEGGGAALCCAVGPDASFVVSWGEDAKLRVWDPVSGRELADRPARFRSEQCAVSPDESFMISVHDFPVKGRGSSRWGGMWIWYGRGWRRRRKVKGSFSTCAVSPDGSLLVSGDTDRAVRLWDPSSGRQLRKFEGHADSVTACAVSPDGSYIVSGSRDGTVKIWDLAAEGSEDIAGGHRRRVTACEVSPVGTFAVSIGRDKRMLAWDPLTGDQVGSKRHLVGILAVALARDGSVSVTSYEIFNVSELGIQDQWPLGKTRSRIKIDDARVVTCGLSPDGTQLFGGTAGGQIARWNLASHEEHRFEVHNAEPIIRCAVSPDGTRLISASDDGTLKV